MQFGFFKIDHDCRLITVGGGSGGGTAVVVGGGGGDTVVVVALGLVALCLVINEIDPSQHIVCLRMIGIDRDAVF